jgi:hypothetical protein
MAHIQARVVGEDGADADQDRIVRSSQAVG